MTPGEFWEALTYPSVSLFEQRVLRQHLAAEVRRERREAAKAALGNGRR